MTQTDVQNDPRVADRPPSIARMFLDRVAASPGKEAFRSPDADGDGWSSMTWRETGDRVRDLAAGLLALGIRSEDRVAIASSTRVDWILADLAIMCAGAATTTVYPSTSHEDVGFILADSGSRVVFAEDADQVEKIRAHRGELPDVMQVVVFDGAGDGDAVITLADLEAKGREHLKNHPEAVDQAVAAINPDDLATLIYTSGTTGRPKGVRLVQDCWVYEGVAIDALGILREDDLQYLWLPLSHSFGKVLQAAQLAVGFSSAVDGRVDKLIDNLAVVKPTFMGAAPRIFEKAHSRINRMAADDGGAKKKIFDWAIGVGKQVSKLRQEGKEPTGMLKVQYGLADKLVFSKIKHRFGGRLRYFVSGSAALSRDVAEWFHAADILILEGYGLTETSAFSFVNRPEHWRFGTVGEPAPGTEVKIASDGEILVRGPGVMRGYHNSPEQTAEVLTADGWFHTGDIGEVDDGMLRITDRKKDLIKTSGGKYVAPQGIEGLFQAVCPYASQIVVHGDGRKYVVALVTLDPEALQGWADKNGLGGSSYEEITQHDKTREMVQGYIDQLNERVNKWETVKKFAILPHDLTIEDGDLTPSLKVKRKAVERKHADILDSMYGE